MSGLFIYLLGVGLSMLMFTMYNRSEYRKTDMMGIKITFPFGLGFSLMSWMTVFMVTFVLVLFYFIDIIMDWFLDEKNIKTMQQIRNAYKKRVTWFEGDE